MSETPELYDTYDYLVPVVDQDINRCKDECIFRNFYPCDVDVFDRCVRIIHERNLQLPRDADEGIELYKLLKMYI